METLPSCALEMLPGVSLVLRLRCRRPLRRITSGYPPEKVIPTSCWLLSLSDHYHIIGPLSTAGLTSLSLFTKTIHCVFVSLSLKRRQWCLLLEIARNSFCRTRQFDLYSFSTHQKQFFNDCFSNHHLLTSHHQHPHLQPKLNQYFNHQQHHYISF